MTDTTQATSASKLFQSILDAMRFDKSGSEDDVASAQALTDVLVAFAAVTRGPVPEFCALESKTDNSQAQILSALNGIRVTLDALLKLVDGELNANALAQKFVASRLIP